MPDNVRTRPPSTAVWRKRFIEEFRKHGNVTVAASAAGVHRNAVYKARKISAAFDAEFGEAEEEATDRLEAVAQQRAIGDGERPGSDLLLIFLLKARRPERYREVQRREISGPDGGPVPIGVTIADVAREMRKAVEVPEIVGLPTDTSGAVGL